MRKDLLCVSCDVLGYDHYTYYLTFDMRRVLRRLLSCSRVEAPHLSSRRMIPATSEGIIPVLLLTVPYDMLSSLSHC